jgi:hypothetical protein
MILRTRTERRMHPRSRSSYLISWVEALGFPSGAHLYDQCYDRDVSWKHYLRGNMPTRALRVRPGRAIIKIAIVLLVVFLAGFSTTLKYGQYRPQGDPIGHVAKINKINVAHTPATFDSAPVETATEIVSPEPKCETLRREPPPPPAAIQVLGLTLTLQHRSPPPSFSS